MSELNDNQLKPINWEDDPTASSRKKDHIELAFKSQVEEGKLDQRFYYEPLLAAHPNRNSLPEIDFLNKKLRVPTWVSSMTGGTELAGTINKNLARACHDFGMGMGLGSCRALLFSDEYLADFNVRSYIGDSLPLYANLGIAQIEWLIEENKTHLVGDLIDKLRVNGLIIHVNPFQEWLQPEGDRFKKPPIHTIRSFLELQQDIPLIIKEVGQGMGYESLNALFKMPLQAVDFAASGGTNFSKLELLRSQPKKRTTFEPLAFIGHSAEEMVELTNLVCEELGNKRLCKQVIISGGVKNFLDGFYLINKLSISCVYGQASGFLKHARGDYKELYEYVDAQVQGLELANAFLKVK